MKTLVSRPVDRVEGHVNVPGDKSISHRALMLGALAEGTTEIDGFLPGDDCIATLDALVSMGVSIDRPEATAVTIEGRGLHGLEAPSGVLDMGNSGTAMRLLAGVLAGQRFGTTLTGDASLKRRPMERVAAPLRLMGAGIESDHGCPPLVISGGRALQGIDYDMPVPSAQVKSAILLAGLYASGVTTVGEPAVTRDHTERMLRVFGLPTTRQGSRITLNGGGRLVGTHIDVPGDLSSAAFFILAACLADEGELVLENVGLNPTRTGILRIFEIMQADLEIQLHNEDGGEPFGRIVARPGRLVGATIPAEYVPLAIDELPLVFMAAALADGETVITGASELRHKESDRISVMVDGLKKLGVKIEERPDGAVIQGGRLSGGVVDSHGDHRIAMSFAIGAVAADGPVTIRDTDNVATSFPDFAESAVKIGLDISSEVDPDSDLSGGHA
jgi:3-phosphoshikimate 1-carboxyvinyltransferase